MRLVPVVGRSTGETFPAWGSHILSGSRGEPDAGAQCHSEGSPKDTRDGWALTWPRVLTPCSLPGDLGQANHLSSLPPQLVHGSASLIQMSEGVSERQAQHTGRGQAWSLLLLE